MNKQLLKSLYPITSAVNNDNNSCNITVGDLIACYIFRINLNILKFIFKAYPFEPHRLGNEYLGPVSQKWHCVFIIMPNLLMLFRKITAVYSEITWCSYMRTVGKLQSLLKKLVHVVIIVFYVVNTTKEWSLFCDIALGSWFPSCIVWFMCCLIQNIE
jgi:hypothetical protein